MTENAIETAERIAVLESQVQTLNDNLKSHAEVTNKKMESVDEKLDELLHLRSKGVGAFWLASSILGTGIVGFVLGIVNWLRG